MGEYFIVQGDMFGDNTIYIFSMGTNIPIPHGKTTLESEKNLGYIQDDRAICYLDLQDKMGGAIFQSSK